MNELALILKAVDMAKLLKDGMLAVKIILACAPIVLDAVQKCRAIVEKELADSGSTPDEVATLFKGLLQGLLDSHVANNGDSKNESK
jgi:hypothetical protein